MSGTSKERIRLKRAALEKRRSELASWLLLHPAPMEWESICLLSAVDIVSKLKKSELKVVEVCLSLCHSCWRAHTATNCVTEFLLESAYERALELDLMSKEEKDAMPLFGVATSVKDNIDVKGVDTSLGYSKFCLKPATEDALIITALKEAGALILCKTNLPQTLKFFETSNPVFGKTTHPMNARYSCGGSSGGEGALISAFGSTVGIGSDDGGSIRLPAHMCGIFGLKPSSLRLPNGHSKAEASKGFDSYLTNSFGPLARSPEDLELVFKTLAKQKLWTRDRTLAPLGYQEVQSEEKKKRVGYFIDNGFLKVSPACARAVKIAVSKLKADGHEVEEIKFPDAFEAVQKYMALASMDAHRRYKTDMLDDPIEYSVKPLLLNASAPDWLKTLLSCLLNLIGRPEESAIVAASRTLSLKDLFATQAYRTEYAAKIAALFAPFDFVLCPVNVNPPIKHGACRFCSFSASYTFLFNFVDFAAGVVPVTTVDEQLDALESNNNGDQQNKNHLTPFEKINMYGYDAKEAHGLPVGVQVVTQRFQEEHCIDAMKLIAKALQNNKKAE